MNDVQPKSARLPPSSSLAIGQLEGRPHVGQFSKVNAVDINRKVEQLLEATAALKGVSKGRGNSSQPSMLNRIKSNKVVAKFSGVFSERFHHKAKGSKVDGKTKAAAKGSPADPTRGGALPLIGHSPIPAVELRLNEGKNLCKSKVKERFGGDLNVRRKPVAGEGRSLRTSQSLDDPFSDAHQIRRSPTRFEARLMETPMTKKYESCISLACSDPFELERVMDTSVDGILPFSPLASSTPRDRRLAVGIDESPLRPESDAKVDAVLTSISESSPILPSRHQTPSDDESPTMKINKATVSCRGDELAARDTCDDPFTRLDSPEIENLSASRGRKTPRSETQALRGLIGAPVLPFSPWGRKKHPSPSKSELEELERQLRKYAPGVFGTTTEEDELAVGYESTKVVRALRPRDPNSLGRRSGSASQGHAGDSGCASLQYFKSHQRSTTGITRNSRSLGHLNGSQAQLGSAAASDIDELQWDASAFNFGQRHQHGPAEAH
ncbi:hypothetical protein NKR23_g7754 [Pleurostoma richardsiae]|uniref:Uncharacterized protein n=1 Tax=Pleurostoma richardsiae TaxID=41990 RepID=A0AA38RSP2_9PEZI|nr:hypothetical protein NKR23_g7754 [Pleurostoma richardsiae]